MHHKAHSPERNCAYTFKKTNDTGLVGALWLVAWAGLRSESRRVKPGSECASPFAAVELKNICCRICSKISSTDSEHKYKSKCWGGRFMGHGHASWLGDAAWGFPILTNRRRQCSISPVWIAAPAACAHQRYGMLPYSADSLILLPNIVRSACGLDLYYN